MEKKCYINNRRSIIAASEVIEHIFLLLIAVCSCTVIYYNVLSIPPTSNSPNVLIEGTVKGNNLVLEHQKGEPLSLDTIITINMSIQNETFVVKQYLNADARKDGEWNIGESVIYPLSYTIDNIGNYFPTYFQATDIESNSLVFFATFGVYPTTDIGLTITADDLHPRFGSEVNFTIIVSNYQGGTPAIHIEILNRLSNTLLYVNSVPTRGVYNSTTGIWNISYLEIGETASLTITAKVTITSKPTQLAMILDGSSSISSNDWNLMRTGLSNAVKNPNVFPNDGTVELTVIQFGEKYWWGTQYARKELGPIIVTQKNYKSIGNTIKNLQQLRGYTPMGCGIYLAADTLNKSQFLNSSDRQVLCLVTDGQPNCNANPKTYTGLFVNDNYVTGRVVAEQARNYLIDTLNLSQNQDEFDVIAVGQDTNTLWLKNNISWPGPGNFAPPYNPGWVRNVSSWQEFSDSIYEMLRSIFDLPINYYAKIIGAIPSTDPNSGNNEVNIILTTE